MSIVSRRLYTDHPDVVQAAADSWTASQATWVDVDNPTDAEQVAAQDARLAATIAACDACIAAE